MMRERSPAVYPQRRGPHLAGDRHACEELGDAVEVHHGLPGGRTVAMVSGLPRATSPKNPVQFASCSGRVSTMRDEAPHRASSADRP